MNDTFALAVTQKDLDLEKHWMEPFRIRVWWKMFALSIGFPLLRIPESILKHESDKLMT